MWFEASDWATARLVAQGVHELLTADRMSAQLFQSVLAGTTQLMSTEADRRRLRIELSKASKYQINQHVTLATRQAKPDQTPDRAEEIACWDRELGGAEREPRGGREPERRKHDQRQRADGNALRDADRRLVKSTTLSPPSTGAGRAVGGVVSSL